MKFNPPLKRGSFEVTSVNTDIHAIHLTIHITAEAEEIKNVTHRNKIRCKIRSQVDVACKFLNDEGYIPSDHGGWRRSVGVIFHNPPGNNTGCLVFS